jgi:hypothetical protein
MPRSAALPVAGDLLHRDARVVIQNRAWHAAQVGKGLVVTFQKRLRVLGRESDQETVVGIRKVKALEVRFLDVGIKLFVNPTGTRLYIFWPRGIDVFDTATLTQIASIPTVGFSISNNFAYFSPDSPNAWFCNCGFGMYYQVDTRTNQVTNTVQQENTGHGFMFGLP